MPRRLGNRPALDGVRAIAITAVMGLHAIARLFPGGFYGVDIFFVLSAFLITSLILEELDDRQGHYNYRAFYWRRVFRLAPALLLWLLIIAPVTAVAIHQTSTIPISTAASLFYFGDFAVAAGANVGDAYTHVWSLAIEEQFYLVWPLALIYLVTKRSQTAQRRALLLAVGASVILADVSGHVFKSNYFLPTGHIACLAVGALGAHMFMRGAGYRFEHALQHELVGPLCLAILAIAIFGHWSLGIESATLLQLAVAAGTGVLLLHLCLRQGGLTGAILSLKPSLWIGKRSYGLYLYHRTLAIFVPALIVGIKLRYAGPLVLAISFVVAWLSFRFVERPVSRAGRAWLRKKDGVAVTLPAAVSRQ